MDLRGPALREGGGPGGQGKMGWIMKKGGREVEVGVMAWGQGGGRPEISPQRSFLKVGDYALRPVEARPNRKAENGSGVIGKGAASQPVPSRRSRGANTEQCKLSQ